MSVQWPEQWQQEAIDVVEPLLGVDLRIAIVFGRPHEINGTLVEGFVYLDGDVPTIIHDHSGKWDVYPWKLFDRPVLRVYQFRPRRRKLILYADSRWTPRNGEKGVYK